MELNSNEIQKIIPHRYPFLLVDKITSCTPGLEAVGIKAVTANEMHFIGHFPDHHVMPGVLIVEALAQVGAVTLLSLDEYKGKIAFFAGINKCRFKQQVVPGDILTLTIKMTKVKGNIGVGEAIAYKNDKVACKAELMFGIE